MYRPSSAQPKGAWARHLHEQRKLRDLSATQAFELVRERMGWAAKSRSAYVPLDLGERQPKEREAQVLAEEFGWPSHDEDGVPESGGQDVMVAALNRQSEAMEAMVGLFRPVVEQQGVRLDDLEALVRRLTERGLGARTRPPSPRQKGG